MPVYPRWRGEHKESVWGDLTHGRFIPAGAGNTDFPVLFVLVNAVYPRWRGEHTATAIRIAISNGLSPLARGTPGARYDVYLDGRFIPAGAGNMRTRYFPVEWPAVYPRWRGEHSELIYCRGGCGGLSPLARGTRCVVQPVVSPVRFIPAGAGNTISREIAVIMPSVYPRWRGEHIETAGEQR